DPGALDPGVDDLEVALDVGAGRRVEDDAAVLVEEDGGRVAGQEPRPGLARILAVPDAAGGAAGRVGGVGHRGVDDHLAVRGELGVDGELVDDGADERAVAGRGADGQQGAGVAEVGGERGDVVGAVVHVPADPAVGGYQEADAR